MLTAKEEVRRLLDTLPDEVTLEDIQYHIYDQEKILKGLDAVNRGDVISQAEVEKRM